MGVYVPNYGKKNFLKRHGIESQSNVINSLGWGYGQVEPNHLAGQATKEVYAQLPAKKDIGILENGQFAKYDYANNQVNFTGPGEWLLVWNEIKLYREEQSDAEFAMLADNYVARVYSPFGGKEFDEDWSKQSRFYNGQGVNMDGGAVVDGKVVVDGKEFPADDVTAAVDPYEVYATEDPFHFVDRSDKQELFMRNLMKADGSKGDVNSMVPRLMKTYIGDIMTMNLLRVGAKDAEVAADAIAVGDLFAPAADDGILTKLEAAEGESNVDVSGEDMVWQVVKVYTMPDHQPGFKVIRIK